MNVVPQGGGDDAPTGCTVPSRSLAHNRTGMLAAGLVGNVDASWRPSVRGVISGNTKGSAFEAA